MRNSVEQCRSRLKLLVFFFFEFLNYYSKNSWEIQNPTTLPSDFLSETSRDCCDNRIRSKQRRKPKKKTHVTVKPIFYTTRFAQSLKILQITGILTFRPLCLCSQRIGTKRYFKIVFYRYHFSI